MSIGSVFSKNLIIPLSLASVLVYLSSIFLLYSSVYWAKYFSFKCTVNSVNSCAVASG